MRDGTVPGGRGPGAGQAVSRRFFLLFFSISLRNESNTCVKVGVKRVLELATFSVSVGRRKGMQKEARCKAKYVLGNVSFSCWTFNFPFFWLILTFTPHLLIVLCDRDVHVLPVLLPGSGKERRGARTESNGNAKCCATVGIQCFWVMDRKLIFGLIFDRLVLRMLNESSDKKRTKQTKTDHIFS